MDMEMARLVSLVETLREDIREISGYIYDVVHDKDSDINHLARETEELVQELYQIIVEYK